MNRALQYRGTHDSAATEVHPMHQTEGDSR